MIEFLLFLLLMFCFIINIIICFKLRKKEENYKMEIDLLERIIEKKEKIILDLIERVK